MPIRDNPRILSRIEQGSACWLQEDFDGLMKSFRDDAVLASPFGPKAQGAENSWITGYDPIQTQLKLIRNIYPGLRRIDTLLGTDFVVVLMGDGEQYLTMHVEPDEQGMFCRLIICCSSSVEAQPISRLPALPPPNSETQTPPPAAPPKRRLRRKAKLLSVRMGLKSLAVDELRVIEGGKGKS